MKLCSKCGIEKPLSEFYKDPRGLFGVRADCITCNNAKSRTYYEDHAEKRRNDHREWTKHNRELARAQKRRWYQRHKETIIDKVKVWKKDNPEKSRKQAIVDSHKRRARTNASSTLGITQVDIDWMLKRDNYQCLACGVTNNLTVDHVIPIFRGGANDRTNIQTLCGVCNSSKGTKVIDYRKDDEKESKVSKQLGLWDHVWDWAT